MRQIRDYLGIFLGVILTAFGLDLFLIPNRLAAGGVSGLATLTYHLLGVPVGLTILLLNVPLFFAGIKWLGKGIGAKTIFGTMLLSLSVDFIAKMVSPFTYDLLLSAVYGGAVTGLGMGITFRFGGTTGGTDLAARLVGKFTNFTTGQALLGIDFLVIALAGLVFDPELAMYAFLALVVSSKVIDLVQEGMSYAKAAFIISNVPDEVANAVMHKLERGVTSLKGKGEYTKKEKNVLMCVLTRSEVSRLKELVQDIDPEAFVIITDVHEVLGEGFTRV